jgi:competence protein ComEC
MSQLNVTMIDVGWGDSILIESQTNNGDSVYALIDSNDTTNFRSSQIFLKRFFERKNFNLPDDKPVFDFVLLSHAHADHGQGLKALMREFGTRQFWYPKSTEFSSLAYLLDYANRSSNIEHHESINVGKHPTRLGDATIEVLWPQHDRIMPDENNNSVVLVLRLNQIAFVLTGDAEAPVWDDIAAHLPPDTGFFKLPHHGSVNGFFTGAGEPAWLDNCPRQASLGISTHLRPFHHPHAEVIQALNQNHREFYRTDESYHLTFSSNGQGPVEVKYSHV